MTVTRVRTETSTYIIDTEDNTLMRLPGDWDVSEGVERHTLRRDAEPMRLIAMVRPPEVGKPMEVYIDARQDGVDTYRRTTYVTEIEEL